MAAPETVTAVEAFAAVKFPPTAASIMESAIAAKFTAVPFVPVVIAPFASAAPIIPVTAPETEAVAITEPIITVIPTAPVEAWSSPVKRVTIVAVEPRSGANEDATDKVVRPVVPIWRAPVWVVSVVAVQTVRGRAGVNWAASYNNRPDSDANTNPYLRLGRGDSANKHQRS